MPYSLPWSMPASRLYGTIEEEGVSIACAEYEVKASDSRLIFNLKVISGSRQIAAVSDARLGLLDWHNQTVTLSFCSLSKVCLKNSSIDTVTIQFETQTPRLEGEDFIFELPAKQRFELLTASKIAALTEVSYEVTLLPGENLEISIFDPTKIEQLTGKEKESCGKPFNTWPEWMAKAPVVDEKFQELVIKSWYCLGVNTVHLRNTSVSDKLLVVPSVLGYVGVWQWDSYFIASGLRHGDLKLAVTQLETVLGFPNPQGQLQDVIHDQGFLYSFADLPEYELKAYASAKNVEVEDLLDIPITKPPLAAWALLKIFEISKDTQLLGEFWEILQDQHLWWMRTATQSKRGLPCYQHPFSSGLDDSPSFDDHESSTPPDLLSYLLLEEELFAEISKLIGSEWNQSESKSRTEMLERGLRESWNPSTNSFSNPTQTGKNLAVTIQSLMPLLTKSATPYAAGLLASTSDSDQFGGEYAVPTVSRNDSKYSSHQMWRGPVWANTNLLVIEGLEAQGLVLEARELALKTLNMIADSPGVFEYYDSATGKPSRGAVDCFSWSAAVCVDLAVRCGKTPLDLEP